MKEQEERKKGLKEKRKEERKGRRKKNFEHCTK